MRAKPVTAAALSAMLSTIMCLAASWAWSGEAPPLAQIVPGKSTKADVTSLFGEPWRVMQFNDCGMAMDGQADETWEYRSADPNDASRIHIEFGDDNVVHLIARIPDHSPDGRATNAELAPAASMKGMSM